MGDIFDLDEERELEQKTAEQKNAVSSSTSSSSSSHPPQPASSTSLLRPPTTTPLLSPLPQPFTQALPQHRKHASSFAATPSFPSPLAQAITVPAHSDTSSNSSNSNPSSDDEEDRQSKRSVASKDIATPRIAGHDGAEYRARTASPTMKEASVSPTSTERSMSRSTSPAPPRAVSVSPGALLSKGRRSDAARDLAPITTATAGSTPRTSPTSRKSSPTQARRLTDASRDHPPPAIPNHVRRRSGSFGSALDTPPSTSSQAGSSPLAFGSPELDPIDDEHPRRTSRGSTSSPQESSRDGSNILGLGLGGNWDTTSSTASSSSRSGSMKGKSKEGPPPSPRRERDRMSTSGMPISR